LTTLIIRLLLVSGLLANLFHPVHVGIVNMEYNTDSGVFELSFKIFRDDFQQAMNKKITPGIDLSERNSTIDNQKQNKINQYIADNFKLFSNGKEMDGPVFDSLRITDDAVWLYYRIKFPDSVQKISILNSVLMDIYPDQTNLLILNYRGKEDGYQFISHQPRIDIEL